MGSDFLEKNKTDFTKDDLLEGDVVTLRNGEKLVFVMNSFRDCNGSNMDNYLYSIGDLDKELKCSNDVRRNSDIIKVERPTQYKIMYERKEEVKEMTLAQVCEELGYNVKIIKEE